MTHREYLTAVKELNISEELTKHSEKELAKLNASLEKKKEKPSKVALANAPLIDKLEEIMVAADKPLTATEIAPLLGVTIPKATVIAKGLAEKNKVVVGEVKVKGRVKKTYQIKVGE